MIVDSSAVVAYLLGEGEAGRVLAALARPGRSLLPAPCFVECSIVLARKQGDAGLLLLDEMIERHALAILPFTEAHARLARRAFLVYGKGRHAAALNFGDCMSYAVAKAEGLPLLFVGNDFSQTDLPVA